MRAPLQFLVVGLPTAPPTPGPVPPEPIAPIAGKVRVAGRFWVNGHGVFRPRFLSGFKLPGLAVQNTQQMRDYLDLAVNLGFNGVRVLAGALTWGPQTADEARRGLPLLLDEAAQRHLTIEVTALSDSGTGYNIDQHLEEVGRICSDNDNTLGEVANEPYHGTQADAVHEWANLASWGQEYFDGIPSWAEGAPLTDEPNADPSSAYYVPFTGPYITCHLDRGRDEWNMVRRVRELENVSNSYQRPVMNNEPIGWAEQSQAGRRCSNPAIAFTMGALSRGFEVGVVSHADHGLQCAMPGPVQTQCHQALVEGFFVYGTDARLTFQNAGWATSPIKTANFEHTIVRAYSFMDSGVHGWTVLLGLTGDPGVVWQNGYQPIAIVAEHPGVQVVEISR